MPRLLRAVLIPAVMLAAVMIGITIVATESREVVVLLTRSAAGIERSTRVWVAEGDGALWIEAANPERGFYADIRRDPHLRVRRRGAVRPYVAAPEPGEPGHRRIRALLRAKYGWADWWLQHVVDTSRSIAVRLDRTSPLKDPRSPPGRPSADDAARRGSPRASRSPGGAAARDR